MKNMESIQNSDPGIEDQASAQEFDSFEEHMKKWHQDIANNIQTDEIVLVDSTLDPDPVPEPEPEPGPEPEPEPGSDEFEETLKDLGL